MLLLFVFCSSRHRYPFPEAFQNRRSSSCVIISLKYKTKYILTKSSTMACCCCKTLFLVSCFSLRRTSFCLDSSKGVLPCIRGEMCNVHDYISHIIRREMIDFYPKSLVAVKWFDFLRQIDEIDFVSEKESHLFTTTMIKSFKCMM